MLLWMHAVTCLGLAGVGIPIILELHRFFVAISRAVVNHDDCAGTAPDPLVWSAGVLLKRRRILDAVRNYDMLLGPAFLFGPLIGLVSFPLSLLLRMLMLGLTLLVSLFSGLLSLVLCVGRLLELTLVWVGKISLGILGQGAQFQCRLFLLVQALIRGNPAREGE